MSLQPVSSVDTYFDLISSSDLVATECSAPQACHSSLKLAVLGEHRSHAHGKYLPKAGVLDPSGRHLQGSETGVDLLILELNGCLIASGTLTNAPKIASYNPIQENDMPLQLPDAVKLYFADSNDGDAAQLASCFSPDATVCDERKTYEGIAAITAWQQDARKAFAYQVHPLQALQEQNRLTVIANVVGNFPGSPLQLSYAFTLEDGRIRSLEITPC